MTGHQSKDEREKTKWKDKNIKEQKVGKERYKKIRQGHNKEDELKRKQ